MSMNRSLEREHCQWVCSYFSSSALPCLVHLLWDGRQVAIHLLFCGVLLPGFVQKCSYLAFSLCISLVSIQCIHTVALTQLEILSIERNADKAKLILVTTHPWIHLSQHFVLHIKLSIPNCLAKNSIFCHLMITNGFRS